MATNLAGRIDRAIRVSLMVLAAGAVLGVVLVVTKTRPEPLPLPPSALSSQTFSLPRTNGLSGGALVENPLFWASRRPYNAPTEEAEEVVQPSGATAIDSMQLVGIVTSGIETSAAIVTIRGQHQRIPLGDKVDGWELTSMTPTEATFIGADRSGGMVERKFNLESRRGQPPVRGQGATNATPNNTNTGAESGTSDSVEDLDGAQNNQDQNG